MIDYEKLCQDLAQHCGLTLWHDKDHTLVYGDGYMETFPVELYSDEEVEFLRSIAEEEHTLECQLGQRKKVGCVCGWCAEKTDNCFSF